MPASSAPPDASRVTVRCRLFARYAELLGRDEVVVQLAGPASVADAVRYLRREVPGADLLPEQPMVAVNLEHARLSHPLNDGDELSFLPPLAGG